MTAFARAILSLLLAAVCLASLGCSGGNEDKAKGKPLTEEEQRKADEEMKKLTADKGKKS